MSIYNYADIIQGEKRYPAELQYCPCIICSYNQECKEECSTFLFYTKADTVKTRKKIFLNKLKLESII
jgi:hypothetical protein